MPGKTEGVEWCALLLTNEDSLRTHINDRGVARKHGLSKQLVRRCLLYDFKVSLSATEYFEDNVVSQRTARHWFKMFKSGDLFLCDELRSGWQQFLDDDTLKAGIEEENSQTSGEVAKRFHVHDETARLHVPRIGMV